MGNPPRPIPIFVSPIVRIKLRDERLRRYELTADEKISDDLPARTGTHTTASAIATEVSNLSRPITADDINRLLERASQSLTISPSDADRTGQASRFGRGTTRAEGLAFSDDRPGAGGANSTRNATRPPTSNPSDPPIEALQATVSRLRSLRERIGEREPRVQTPGSASNASDAGREARRADRLAANALRRQMRDAAGPPSSGGRGNRDTGMNSDTADPMSLTIDERFQRLLSTRPRPGERVSDTYTRIQNAMIEWDNDRSARSGSSSGSLDPEAHLPTSTSRRDREARQRLAHIRCRAPSPQVSEHTAQGVSGLPATNLEVIRKHGPPLVVSSAAPTPATTSPQSATSLLPSPVTRDEALRSNLHTRSNSPLPTDATPPSAPPPRIREPPARPAGQSGSAGFEFGTAFNVDTLMRAIIPLPGITVIEGAESEAGLSNQVNDRSANRTGRPTQSDAAQPEDDSLTRRGQRIMRAVAGTTSGDTIHTRRDAERRPDGPTPTARMHPADTDAPRRSARSRIERHIDASTNPTTSGVTYESAQRALYAAREERIRVHERYLAIQQATRALYSPRPGGQSAITTPPPDETTAQGRRVLAQLEALQALTRDELVAAQIRESRAVATREWAASPLREVNPPIVGRNPAEPTTRTGSQMRHDILVSARAEAIARDVERPDTRGGPGGTRRTEEIPSYTTVPHPAPGPDGTARRQRGSTAAQVTAVDMYPPQDSSAVLATTEAHTTTETAVLTPSARTRIATDADRAAVTRRLMAAEERLDLAMAELQDQQAIQDIVFVDPEAQREHEERTERATWRVADAASRAAQLLRPEAAPTAEDIIREAMESAIRQRETVPDVQEVRRGVVPAAAPTDDSSLLGGGDHQTDLALAPNVREVTERRLRQEPSLAAASLATDTTGLIAPTPPYNGDTRSRRASRDRILAEANALVPQLGRGVVGRIETISSAGRAATTRQPVQGAGIDAVHVPVLRDGDTTVVDGEGVLLSGTDSEVDSSSEEEDDSDDDVDEHEDQEARGDEANEHDHDIVAGENGGSGHEDRSETGADAGDDEARSADSGTTTIPPSQTSTTAATIDSLQAQSPTSESQPHHAITTSTTGETDMRHDLLLQYHVQTRGTGKSKSGPPTAEMGAHVWPVAPAKKTRRPRPYVSLIDL